MFSAVPSCLHRSTLLAPKSVAVIRHSFESPRRTLLPSSLFSTSAAVLSSVLPTPPNITHLPDPNAEPKTGRRKGEAETTTETLNQVRQWVDSFKAVDPTTLREAKGIELSFSRSSGPGGQNVNKVNTKATVRCDIEAPWIPVWAKEVLADDPHYTASSRSILVTSTTTRSQAQNIHDCLLKLRAIVLTAATTGLKNATPEEKKKRVGELVKAEKAQRRLNKDHQSSVKRNRSFKGYD